MRKLKIIIFLLFAVNTLARHYYEHDGVWYCYTRDNCRYDKIMKCREKWEIVSSEYDLYRNYTDIGNIVTIPKMTEPVDIYVRSTINDNNLTPEQKKINCKIFIKTNDELKLVREYHNVHSCFYFGSSEVDLEYVIHTYCIDCYSGWGTLEVVALKKECARNIISGVILSFVCFVALLEIIVFILDKKIIITYE